MDRNDIAILLAHRYSIPISDAERTVLAGLVNRKEYNKEDTIIEMRHRSRHLFFVEQGMVRQYYYKDGRNITEHFTCEGDLFFCIESLFLHEPTRLAAEAIEHCVVWTMDYEALKAATDYHPGINRLLQTILEQDLVLSQRKADSWRFESSHERYERFCREYPQAAQRASIAHIASYLLMSPETLSRVRAGVL